MSQRSFRELGVSERVVDALAARSIHTPFRIQELVLPDALAGLDVLAKSPTGSGKTLAFAIPIAERTVPSDRHVSALVLVPTRELASQVTADFEPIELPGGHFPMVEEPEALAALLDDLAQKQGIVPRPS